MEGIRATEPAASRKVHHSRIFWLPGGRRSGEPCPAQAARTAGGGWGSGNGPGSLRCRHRATMPDETQAVSPHIGQRHRLTITDVAFGGAGVGRLGDFVVFVPFVIAGEEVEVELSEVKRQFARARLLDIRWRSPSRVTPVCRYFGACGGCQYQHIAYQEQLRLKHKQVTDLVQRLGRFRGVVVKPVMPCPEPLGYRNRLMVRSQWDKAQQRLVIGFLRHDSRLVVDVEECALAEPALNQELIGVRQHPPPHGGLKVVIRQLPEGWEVPEDSFFQTNRFLLPRLAEVIRESLQASGARHLIDVYCGVGFFAVETAGVVSAFVGVECDRLAIQAARQNAAARGLTNGEFVVGQAEECLPALLARFEPMRTAVILDPPRAGCHPRVIQRLRIVRPAQVLYVSCHPATLARDLNALCAEGVYRLMYVQPLDMFPQTQHVECVADLRLAGAGGGSPTEHAGRGATATAAHPATADVQTNLAKAV